MYPLLLLALIAAPLYPAYYLYDRLSFFGAFRNTFDPISKYSNEYFTIPIAQSEDIVLHSPSGLILAIGQGNIESRAGWFPGWANFDRPKGAAAADGGVWVINPKTWEYERLEIVGMDGPFITHGIDIWYDHAQPDLVYLHAVNHVPVMIDGIAQPHSDSRIEVFQIDLAAEKKIAKHLKSLNHELVHTPNDIYSLGPFDLLVTNDHINTRGHRRTVEDLFTFKWSSNTNIVRLREDGAKVVASGLHNANGLGHGPNGTVTLGDAAGGDLTIFSPGDDQLVKKDYLALGIQLDNPTYYSDPYAGSDDASGYVLGGLLSGIHLDKTCRDPYAKVGSSVWIARRDVTGKIQKKLLIEDDGSWVSGAAVGLIIPIEPKAGKKEGWMVVTGPFSLQIGVAKIILDGLW